VSLTLYNTLTRTKEAFAPLDPAHIRMYVCGPTVYDYAHIGNARPVIVFDVLFRLLRHLYGPDRVAYVRNITDVDDKINARAGRDHPELPLNDAIRKVTEKTEAQFHDDMHAIGALDPTVEPRATEHIGEMRTMIDRLIANGCAYVAEDHVLFHVGSMTDYGKLSGRSLDEMIAGARVEVAPYKKDAMDFVLWKPSKPGEPSWPSPGGIETPGRPGWHIECSAMSAAHLGEVFDIHGGGIDLVFPHHENEIAQSRCAHGTHVMANVWMHNGFLQVEGQKMSKSLGNFVTVHELLTGWQGPAWPGSSIRWAMLQTHYRQPIDWTFDQLRASTHELIELLNILRGSFREAGKVNFTKLMESIEGAAPSRDVLTALLDDLNTPAAIAAIRARKGQGTKTAIVEAARDLRFLGVLKDSDIKHLSAFHGMATDIEDKEQATALALKYQVARANNDHQFASNIVGQFDQLHLKIKELEPSLVVVETQDESADFSALVQTKVEARDLARRNKNYAEADAIRDELNRMGIKLEDAKDPVTGEIRTTWTFASGEIGRSQEFAR